MVTSDFGGGGRYNVLDPRNQFTLPGLTPVHSDASLRYENGRVYVTNRLGQDSIQILNPGLANLTEREFSVGSGTNPQDFVLINTNKGYVSRYESRSILIVNPSTGTWIGEIDLSSYAESASGFGAPDGFPEMSSFAKYNNRIFLSLQRLDRNDPSGFFPPTDRSILLELDPNTNQVLGEYNFQSTNPFSRPQIVTLFGDPHIIFATPGFVGFIGKLDGGVEAFNLRTNEFRSGFLLEEGVVGGDILDVQVAGDNLGFASVLDSNFNKKIISFNPSNGSSLENLIEVPNTVSTNFSGLLLTREGLLVVGIRDFSGSGVVVFETRGGVRRTTPVPIRTELTPTDFVELVE